MWHFSKLSLYRSIADTYCTIIFGEPIKLKLASGHKDILHVDLVTRGKAAHSGYLWLGWSANSMLMPALVALDWLGNVGPGLAQSDKYGNSTVNVGRVKKGVATNVVAKYAQASVLIRLAGGTVDECQPN
jgi:acetylornithine deacetylase